MEAGDLSRQPIVVTGKAAALLLDPTQVRYLEPFLGREATATEVARQLGEPVNIVHYRVMKMLKLGLLEMKREQRRAGRPTKWYGSRAERFFAPFSDSPGATLADALTADEAEWQQRLTRGLARVMERAAPGAEWGVEFFSGPEGRLAKRLSRHPGGTTNWWRIPGTLNWWETDIYLSREEADNLAQGLNEVLAQYRKGSTKERGARYIVRIAIAPDRG